MHAGTLVLEQLSDPLHPQLGEPTDHRPLHDVAHAVEASRNATASTTASAYSPTPQERIPIAGGGVYQP